MSDTPITEITEMAKRLRLPHLRRSFADLAATAKAQRWDPIELIRVLLETEIDGRNAATLTLRRSAANLPGMRTLGGFDHSVSSIPTHIINGLATMEWVRRKENLAILGPPGTGKSFLAERWHRKASRPACGSSGTLLRPLPRRSPSPRRPMA